MDPPVASFVEESELVIRAIVLGTRVPFTADPRKTIELQHEFGDSSWILNSSLRALGGVGNCWELIGDLDGNGRARYQCGSWTRQKTSREEAAERSG